MLPDHVAATIADLEEMQNRASQLIADLRSVFGETDSLPTAEPNKRQAKTVDAEPVAEAVEEQPTRKYITRNGAPTIANLIREVVASGRKLTAIEITSDITARHKDLTREQVSANISAMIQQRQLRKLEDYTIVPLVVGAANGSARAM